MLIFSNSSFLMSFLFSNLLIIILYFIFRNTNFLMQIGHKFVLFLFGLTFFRLIFVFEIPCSTNILLPESLSNFIIFFKTPNIHLGNETFSVWQLFLFVWMIGVCISGVTLIVQYYKFTKSIKLFGKDISDSEPYKTFLHTICQKKNKRNNFRVFIYPGIRSPMITGIKKPFILIPEDFNIESDDLYYILCHETAHFFHHDMILKLLSQILCVIFWWNPFAVLFKKQIYKMLEMRIDLNIIDSFNSSNKIGYLNSLINMAKLGNKDSVESAISFSDENESLLIQRFHMIINNSNKTISRKKQIICFVLMASLYIFSIMFIFEPHAISKEDKQGVLEITAKNSYFVKNLNNTFDLYMNGEYIVTLNSIDESLEELPVYEGGE